MRRAGFTLMELLIVIGIIMLLMGLLFPVFNMIKRQAQKVKCRTLIHQIDAACDHYKLQNGSYPDTPANWTGATMASILAPTPATPKTADVLNDADWTSVANILLASLSRVDRDIFGIMTKLNDPWGHAIHYRPVQYYPYKPAPAIPSVPPNPAIIDTDKCPRPDSYQVWSIGVDEVDQFADPTSDDIPNWK